MALKEDLKNSSALGVGGTLQNFGYSWVTEWGVYAAAVGAGWAGLGVALSLLGH